jgi:NitT/TauT family transport system substrate-binding protein
MLAGIHPAASSCLPAVASRRSPSSRESEFRFPRSAAHTSFFISTILSHVGLNPQRDVEWLAHPPAESMKQLAAGKVDALVGFPPVPQEMRAKKIGHVILNSVADKPWSQYFCCVLAGNREFVKKESGRDQARRAGDPEGHHVCASEPEATAKFLVQRGFTPNYDYALQAVEGAALRRCAISTLKTRCASSRCDLRRKAGYIKSSRRQSSPGNRHGGFLNELKKELKA